MVTSVIKALLLTGCEVEMVVEEESVIRSVRARPST